MYAGLTGHRFNGADCYKYGLATHYTPLEKFGELTEALKNGNLSGEGAKEILDKFHQEPTEAGTLNDDDLSFIESTTYKLFTLQKYNLFTSQRKCKHTVVC